MTDPDTPPSVGADNAIASALAPMQIIAETVVGYHKKLRDGGINDESAGRMAEAFHDTLLNMMKTQFAGQALKGAVGMMGRKR